LFIASVSMCRLSRKPAPRPGREPARYSWRLWSSPGLVESCCWIPCHSTEESGVGQRGHPLEFRRKVPDLVEAGRPIAEVPQALGISDRSIYTWRRQDRVDHGVEPAPNVKMTTVSAGHRLGGAPAGIEPATPSLPWIP
jgi:Transposase